MDQKPINKNGNSHIYLEEDEHFAARAMVAWLVERGARTSMDARKNVFATG